MTCNKSLIDKFSASSLSVLMTVFLFSHSGCGSRPVGSDIKNKNIICFGDSITEGVGANPGEDFPSLLSVKLNRPVINAGRSGDTTQDALKRIQGDVLDKNPGLVIVEFGANDYLKKIPMEETFQNLDKTVELLQAQGAVVVLVTVKIGIFFDEYYKGFKKIARERKILLVSDILKGIFTDPKLKSDGLHPNSAGYKIIADRIYKAILPVVEEKR